MKDSGIEWIGEIPEGWEIRKIKNNFMIYAGATPKSEKAEYWDGGVPWITPADFKTTDKYASYGRKSLTALGYDSCGTTLVPAGSIIFSKRAPVGSVVIAKNALCTNQGCLACIPNDVVNSTYFYYCMSIFTEQFELVSSGTTFKEIAASTFANFLLPYPPLSQQNKIVDFLDKESSHVDSMLTKTRSSIEEYKKLKQAVITQAVTKGVRGEREMKDSGVEWIGEIPKEWRKTQLRHCATIKSGITLGKSYSKDTVLIERPYLRVANVQGGYVDLNDLATIEVTPDEDLKYRLHSGDVLMTEGGDRDKLGRGCVWHGEIEPCLHQNHVFAVQTNETILLPEFLEYLTASDVGRSYFDVTAIKTTNLACTSSSKVLAFTIPLPPIEEQTEIVDFIKKRSSELNKLIMKKELLVNELESYKKSLIYEVVTGKREV